MNFFILHRLWQTCLTAIFVSMIVFGMVRLTGDPTILLLPTEATEADRNFLREQLGLQKPLHKQYLTFMSRVFKGDLGISFRYREPATGLVLGRLKATLELAGASLVLAIVLAVPIGILAAVNHGSKIDNIARWFAAIGQATPVFWFGIIMIMIFSVHLGWFPTSGRNGIRHLVLPAITLGLFSTSAIARLTRSSMLEALQNDFVHFERLSGIPEWLIVMKHCLRNAAIPIITYIALQFGVLISGAVVTETVFAWPGLGMLVVDAVMRRDYPVIQAAVMISAMCILLINFIVDLIYGWLDPRILPET
jgi:peptide/nickel transport system permease protein